MVSQSLLLLSFHNLFLERVNTYEISFIIGIAKLINSASLAMVVLYFLSMVLMVYKISTKYYMASQRLLFLSMTIRMMKLVNFTSLAEVIIHFLSIILVVGGISTFPANGITGLSKLILNNNNNNKNIYRITKILLLQKNLAEQKMLILTSRSQNAVWARQGMS